jgi:hypothetical protein
MQQEKGANHLHYNIHCRHHSATPGSLKLKSTVKGSKADAILRKAEQALLAERIHQCILKNNATHQDIVKARHHLQAATNTHTFNAIEIQLKATYRATYDTSREQQRHKYDKLQSQQQQQPRGSHLPHQQPNNNQTTTTLCADITKEKIDLIRSLWVYNTMNIPITEPAKRALSKGLSFTPTPREPPTADLIVAAEQAATLLGGGTEAATHIRSHVIGAINTYKPPQPNLTKDEREALKELKKNPEITIMPADKGRATVIVPKVDYKNKMVAIINDTAIYRQLPGDPTTKAH